MLGEFEEAIKYFDVALDLRPGHYAAICGKAASLNALRRFEEARELWLLALQEDPSATFVRRGLAHSESELAKNGSPQPARTAPMVSDEAKQAARDELDRGRSFHKDRDFESAIACFEHALQIDPGLGEAAVRLGMALEDDRQFRKAIEAYELALTIEPDNFQAATNVGEAHRKNERYHEAISAYDRALEVKDDYLYALAGRAESMRMLGDYEGSLVWFDKSLAVAANHAFALQGKAAARSTRCAASSRPCPCGSGPSRSTPQSQFAHDGKTFCETQLARAEEDAGRDRGRGEHHPHPRRAGPRPHGARAGPASSTTSSVASRRSARS